MTIEIEGISYGLKEFLFKEVKLTENFSSNAFSSSFLTQWISGCKEFEIYTSGSSGTPKKITLKRKWLETSALQTIGILKLWDENVLCCLPTNKIGGLMMLIRAMAGGFNLSIHEPVANPMLKVINNHSFTFVSLVPYQLNKILEDEQSISKLNRFKIILLGGSDLSSELTEKIEKLSPDIYHTYGMTETCSHIALKKLNHGKWPHFMPNPYIDIITDNEGRVSVRGFQTGNEWIHTTDVIKLYPDGGFDFIGRADYAINTGGYKVYPENLELKIRSILQPLDSDLELAVTGRVHKEWGQELVLVLNKQLLASEMLKLFKQNLKSHEIPKRFIEVKYIPLLENGKTDRIKLKNLAEEKTE